MSKKSDFRRLVTSLWFRLITLGIVALVFAEALLLAPGKASGWAFYLTAAEVAFEVVVRLVFAALVGIALGTLCTAVATPFLWHFNSSRVRIADWATKVGVFLVVFLDSRFALTVLIKSWWSNHGPRFTTALLTVHFLAFAVALFIPRTRREVATSLDGFLRETMTRRTAIATVGSAAALVATEFALGMSAPAVRAALSPQRPKSNFLLITFDALSAEDMSLYGYRLPTTPNIDAFAQKSTVFTNFYAGSTFTTPGVAAIMTGLYPSESLVYQLQGKLPSDRAEKSLPRLMQAAGYATCGFFSNGFAYYLGQSSRNGFDALPEPVFQPGMLHHLWDVSRPLHQNTGFGCRIDEYRDLRILWNSLSGLPQNLPGRFPAVASFENAARMLSHLPEGFFMWVHVMTPHYPYLPDLADRGRFTPHIERQMLDEDDDRSWYPHYPSSQQSQVNERRLRYDEFVATADRAFANFMTQMGESGKLENTTVIVSADHGESFEGGVYQHDSPYLTRPVIHIPLIIRTPGQQQGCRVAFTADQTSIATTILELASQPKPSSMRGQSLVDWIARDGQGEGQGVAFSQYLERNSVFKPVRHGTVAVTDGHHQYVVYLDTQKGELRPLSEAQFWNIDRTSEYPEQAQSLRSTIRARFPSLIQ